MPIKLICSVLLLVSAMSMNTVYQNLSTVKFLQQDSDLSTEIIDYIMTDVEKGEADPTDAYYNIQDMIDDGTLVAEDGQAAMD